MTEPQDTSAQDGSGEADQQSNYTPPATQADLDRIISERVARTKNQFKDYADLKAKLAEYEPIVEAQKTADQRKDEELSRWQSEAQTWRTQALSHRIEALAAASEFADPSDAVAALADKVSGYLDAGGQINEQQIRADLADVLERKPHWRRPTGTEPVVPRVPAPNPSQGSSGGRPVSDPAQELASIFRSQLGT